MKHEKHAAYIPAVNDGALRRLWVSAFAYCTVLEFECEKVGESGVNFLRRTF